MKKLMFVLFLPLLLSFDQGSAQAVAKVGSDIQLGEPIRQFNTFSWVKDIDEIPSDKVLVGQGGVLVYNNESARNRIKQAIAHELTAKGFKRVEADPDMVVNFIVFEQKGRLRTYQGYQVVGGDSVRTKESVDRTRVKPGTLLITMLGGHDEGVVWQGYASGILTPASVKKDAKIKLAVEKIMDKFDYKAFAAGQNNQ